MNVRQNDKHQKTCLQTGVWLLKQASAYSRAYIPVNFIHCVCSIFTTFTMILFPKWIVDELMAGKRVERLVLLVGSFLLINLFAAVIRSWTGRYLEKQTVAISSKLSAMIFEKTLTMDYASIEDEELLTKREFALNNLSQSGGVSGYLNALWNMLTISISIAGLVYLIFTASVWLPLIIVGFELISLGFDSYFKKRQFLFQQRNAENNKLFSYLLYLNSDYKHGKEARIYRMGGLFAEKFRHFMAASFSMFQKVSTMMALNKVISFTLSMLLVFAIGCVLSQKYLSNPAVFTIGSLLMTINALLSFESNAGALLSTAVDTHFKTKLLREVAAYVEMPEEPDGGKPVPQADSYTFTLEEVSYRYPGSETDAIHRLSCTISSGETLAVVGENGAGKTTLIKLLLRLYKPSEGCILLNGEDIQQYSRDAYFTIFSIVFQDFEIFSYPVDENLSCGARPMNSSAVNEALERAGLKKRMAAAPRREHSYVTTFFHKEGIDFSGGELQKLAIARAVYKNAPVVIMDEPTAALDPRAEEEIFENLHQLSKGKTALFISHRLSSCRFCDQILVLDKGRLLQYGTHTQLMKEKGQKYAQLFEAQAQYYTEDRK